MNLASDCAAFVGIDWEDERPAVYVCPADGGKPWHEEIEQKPEAIAAWAAELNARFGGRQVAVCLEQSRGALIYSLMQYGFLILYPINPKQLSNYRQALYPSGSKSDPTDAELLARFLRDHFDKLRVWRPDDVATRGLRLLTERRRAWVEERVAHVNELRQRLKESYPLALELGGGNLDGRSFLALLERFPSQRELQRASPRQIERYLPKRRRTVDDPSSADRVRNQIAAIRQALPVTTDAAILNHARLAVRHLVVLIQSLNRAVAECEQEIAELFARHPDFELFSSLPGAGGALAPRLAAAYGTDRSKFQDARDLQQLSGIAPVTKASGKSKVVQMRWGCPKFLRQTFHEFARCSVKSSRWAQAYLDLHTARGRSYQAIIRSLAFKWQRILFQCWKTRQCYDESRYLRRLRETGAELLKFLAPDPNPTP